MQLDPPTAILTAAARAGGAAAPAATSAPTASTMAARRAMRVRRGRTAPWAMMDLRDIGSSQTSFMWLAQRQAVVASDNTIPLPGSRTELRMPHAECDGRQIRPDLCPG